MILVKQLIWIVLGSIALVACNLSAGNNGSLEPVQMVITATPQSTMTSQPDAHVTSSSGQCDASGCQPITTSPICNVISRGASITNIYSEPANWSAIVGQLSNDVSYRVVARSTSGWYQLDIGGWIPPNYVQLLSQQVCVNLPEIVYDPPFLTCHLVNSTGEIMTIYTTPEGEYYGRFASGSSLGIIKREGVWYQVYVPAFNSAGWVDGAKMGLSGDCSNFE